MRRAFVMLVLTICAASAAAQNLTITPTTTYAAETGVNTSEPAGFTTQTDGNVGGANVSKVDTHTLIYPGFNGNIYAHVVGWFGGSNHENIGYNSSDPSVVKAQINDMVSRGINGIVHVWYGGVNDISNNEAFAVMNEAPNHPGFSFGIMIDHGAIEWNSCYPSCTATQAVIQMTQYIANNFFPSPSYMRINGRPMITEFDIDANYSVDWNQVAANTPGNPVFIFQNNGGFTHTQTGGSFSWVMPTDSNYGLDYLGSFYSTGQSYPTLATFGATYKGFNDTLASWTQNRIMDQQCGQTWLQTFQKLNSMYNSSLQIPALQLVTWDDYEEGTEIETGIDNCLSVSASMSGTTLNWALSGTGLESTIDHYTVFISTDGTNLMSLGDFAAGTHSLDISTFSPAAGTYTLYVKAVGKPSITNKMSNATTLTISGSTSSSGLSVTPTSGNAPLSVTATVTSTALSTSGSTTTITWGDGTTTSGTTGTHTYSTPGTYTVSATGTGSMNVTAKAVAPVAALSLSATSSNAGTAISASTVASSDPNQGGSITASTINWGDGTMSAGPSASHAYSAGGTYTVTATVTDNYGASSTATQSVTISAVPTAVTISSPVNGSTVNGPQVHVTASASSPNGVASMIVYVDYNQVGPVYYSATLDTYLSLAPGSHLIAVNSWDTKGNLIQSTTSNITVAAVAPTTALSLSATTVIAPGAVTANVTSTDPNVGGSISNTTINWGDGSSSNGASASHTYSNAGTFVVTATATDNYGKSASAGQTVTVQAPLPPTASMTVSMNGPTATVTSTSTAGSGSITSSVINWGDGTSTTSTSVSHTYNKGGYYTITLTVTNSYSKTASASQQVTAAGVVIWLPQQGTTAAEPVHIAATAYDSKPIASMIVYLDGNQVYLGYVNDFDVWIQMTRGQHTIVVKGWEDVTGVVYQSSVRFKAQ